MFVLDDCSADEYDVARFMYQLDESHILDLDDIKMSMVDDCTREADHEREEDDPEWRRSVILWRHKQASRRQGQRTSVAKRTLLCALLG